MMGILQGGRSWRQLGCDGETGRECRQVKVKEGSWHVQSGATTEEYMMLVGFEAEKADGD